MGNETPFSTDLAEKLAAAREQRAKVFCDQIKVFLGDYAATLTAEEVAGLNEVLGGSTDDVLNAFRDDGGIFIKIKARVTGEQSPAQRFTALKRTAVSGDVPPALNRGETMITKTLVPYNEKDTMPSNPSDPLTSFFGEQAKPRLEKSDPSSGAELFLQRLRTSSESPSKDSDGNYLKASEIEKNFKSALKAEGYPPYLADHIVVRYLTIPRESIRELVGQLKESASLGQEEKTEIRRNLESWHQYRDDIMRRLVQQPSEFGIDKEAAGKSPELPSLESLKATLSKLSYETASLTRDDEFLFFINGNELPLRDVANLSVELVKSVAPEGDNKDRWVNTFRSECLDLFFDKIAENRFNKRDSQDVRTEKAEARLQTYASLAIFLKEVVVDGRAESYGRLIVDGEPEPDQQAQFPNLELRLPLRIRGEISKIPKERKGERNRKIRDFFATRIEKRGEDYLGFIREQYLADDVLALYDEAGPKWITLFTEEINAMLREVGFSATEIDDAYGSALGQLITTRAGLLKDRAEYVRKLSELKRKEAVTDVELGTAKESLDRAEAALKKNDRGIVEAVRLRLQAPDLCKLMDAGKGVNRKLLESFDDADTV